MPRKPTWDITNRPDPDNIRRILDDLCLLSDVPLDAIEALESLLVRVEDTERRLSQRAQVDRKPATQVRDVTHKSYARTVGLLGHTIICRVCNRMVVVYRYPGAIPTICDSDECQEKARKQDNADRVRRWRERQKAKAQEKPDDSAD